MDLLCKIDATDDAHGRRHEPIVQDPPHFAAFTHAAACPVYLGDGLVGPPPDGTRADRGRGGVAAPAAREARATAWIASSVALV
jgi:hypothetical protein